MKQNRKRLIDADILITDIQGTVSEVCMNAPYDPDWFSRLHDRQREIITLIDMQTAVDAVNVVRCKNCVHYRPYKKFGETEEEMVCMHPRMAWEIECYSCWLSVEPDNFCSYGERRANSG